MFKKKNKIKLKVFLYYHISYLGNTEWEFITLKSITSSKTVSF